MTRPANTNTANLAPSVRVSASRRKRVGRRLRRAKVESGKLLARMERAVEAGDVRRARKLQRLYLSSFNPKLAAVAQSNRKVKAPARALTANLVGIAESINPRRAPTERVTAYAIDKPGRRQFRTVIDFGIKRRSLQYLVRTAIKPFLTFDDRQHAVSNGGRNEACRRIHRALEDGYRWFVGLDIERFYPSIDQRRLINIIPAPRNIIHAVTSLNDDNVIVGRIGNAVSSFNLIQDARRGVSQGSALSPIIAEAIIARLMKEIDVDFPIVNFADDFGVMARTKREAQAASMALINAARRSPFGHFQLKFKTRPVRVGTGFEFLGYRFNRAGPHISCRATERNEEKFFTKSLKLIWKIQRRRPGAVEELRCYVKSWSQAFELSKHGDDLLWPRIWVRGVAREHAPLALPAIELAMEWEGDDFKPIPVDTLRSDDAEPSHSDLGDNRASTTSARPSRDGRRTSGARAGIWSRSRPTPPAEASVIPRRIVATPVVPITDFSLANRLDRHPTSLRTARRR